MVPKKFGRKCNRKEIENKNKKKEKMNENINRF